MQTQPRSWKSFQRYNVVSFVVSTWFIVIFSLGLSGVTLRARTEGAHARAVAACSQTDRIHIVVGADTLASIAAYYGLSEPQLLAYNHRSDKSHPDSINTNQSICIPSMPSALEEKSRALPSFNATIKMIAPRALAQPVARMRREKRAKPVAPMFQAVPVGNRQLPIGSALWSVPRGFAGPLAMASGYRNAYPFGQCTWWATQRYRQLHNEVVPWTMNANAGQWVDRATNFGWHVSSVPTVGSILVLHGGVQGADPVGHVAVVEKVLNNGAVVASSMNWGGRPGAVTNSLFFKGRGVAFVSR